MSLSLVSLSSGSKGNATLIFSDNSALLVDAGLPVSKLEAELKEFGLSAADLDGVVVSHEHDDHIRGLKGLAKQVRVYAHPLTRLAIERRQGGLENAVDVDDFENGFKVGDIDVQPFRIPHDAAYPLAFSFSLGWARCSVATDIGTPTMGLLRNVKDSAAVLLEANHDVDMLKKGSYPYPLKMRILSDKGHMSNADAARVAGKLSGHSEVKYLILGHISQQNNTEKLAYDAVKEALSNACDKNICLALAHQGRRSEVFRI